jgi:hypothetical protein
MPSAGFQPAVPATKHPQTYALDSAATGIGALIQYLSIKLGRLFGTENINNLLSFVTVSE